MYSRNWWGNIRYHPKEEWEVSIVTSWLWEDLAKGYLHWTRMDDMIKVKTLTDIFHLVHEYYPIVWTDFNRMNKNGYDKEFIQLA